MFGFQLLLERHLVVYNEGHVSSLGDKRRVAIRDIKMGMDVSRAAHDARVN